MRPFRHPRGRIPPQAAWVFSPWYGILEIVGEPGATYSWGTECWNAHGHVGGYVTETLRPLTEVAAELLGRAPGDPVWNEQQVRAWENEPIRR